MKRCKTFGHPVNLRDTQFAAHEHVGKQFLFVEPLHPDRMLDGRPSCADLTDRALGVRWAPRRDRACGRAAGSTSLLHCSHAASLLRL